MESLVTNYILHATADLYIKFELTMYSRFTFIYKPMCDK